MDQSVSPASWGATPVDAAATPPQAIPAQPVAAQPMDPSAWGAKPVAAPQPKPEAKPEGFWQSLTEGGTSAMLKETLPGMIYQRITDVHAAEKKFNEDKEWDKEVSRRKKAGISLEGMEAWKYDRIYGILKESKGGQPDQSIGEIWDGVKKAAIDNPSGFAGKLVRGFILHPELLFTPELLPAKMAAMAADVGKTAATVAKAGTEAAQIGAVSAGESALSQANQYGQVRAGQTAMDTAMATVPVVGARALTVKAKTSVSMAVDMAVTKEAMKNGAEPSSELTRRAVAETESRMASGQRLEQALKESLEAVKVSPEAAADAVAMLKPEEVKHAPEERKVSEDNQPQHQRTDTPRVEAAKPQADRGNRPVPSKEVGAQEKEKVATPQQFKPLPEEIPNRFVTPQEASAIYEMAGMDPEVAAAVGDKPIAIGVLRQRLTKFMGGQRYADSVLLDAVREGKLGKNMESGKVDPELLKILGLAGAGAAAAAIYTKDPKDAVIGALAVGGVVAGAALLRGSVNGLRELGGFLKDKRFRVTHLTDDFWGLVKSGELANFRFSEQIKTMVGDAKMRESITHYLQGDESIKLTPEAQAVADNVREWFKMKGEEGQKAGVLEGLLDDYVTQLWTGLNKNDSLFRNLIQSLGKTNARTGGMSPNTRFSMERVIPSYKEGMAKGLIPVTTDIADIIKIYGGSVNRAIANKNFIAALKRERMSDGRLILGSHEALVKEASAAIAKTRDQWQGSDNLVNDIRRFAESKIRNDYVPMDNKYLSGMQVHKDVAPVLKWFFDVHDPNAATKLLYATSVAAKRGLFSFSFFHNASLGQAMLGTSMAGWGKVLNGDAWRALHSGTRGDVVDELVRGGLNVVERPLEGDATPFSNMLKLIYERHPIIGVPAKGMHMIQNALDSFLWSTVQPTFKTAVGMAAFEKTLKRSPKMSRTDAAKVAASFTNDIFGGLDWYRIADSVQNKIGRDLALAVTSPAGKRFMQIMALAPDWTVATARTMIKIIPGISKREINALHQGYVVRSALIYAIIGDGLNMHYSGHHFWENDDPTMVDLGDGRKLQLSKHFMEPIHWLRDPVQQAMNKLGYVPKEVAEQALNKQYLSAKGAPPIVPDSGLLDRRRLTHMFGSASPITGQMAFEQGAMPAISGFFGFPVYGKTDEQAEAAARKSAEQRQEEWESKSDAEKKGHRPPAGPDDAAKRTLARRERARKKAEEARSP